MPVGKKRTHEEFIKLMEEANPNIEVLGTYVNDKTKIKVRCKLDGHIWEATPDNLTHGKKTGCPKCAINNKRKPHTQFINELYKVNPYIEVIGTYVNVRTKIKCKCKIDGHIWEARPDTLLSGYGCPKCKGRKLSEQFITEFKQNNTHANDIEILGTYVNSKTKILCKCKKDGYEWETLPKDLLRGHGCPKCALNNKTKTHEQFMKDLQEVNQNIEILGTYINTSTKIKCKCKIDEYEWETTPNRLLSGSGCPKCGRTKRTKTHEQFITELQEINPDILVLETYKGTLTPIKCKCKKDGYEWEARPGRLLEGCGCPKCNTSKGEKRVAQYLDNLGIEYVYNRGYFNDLVGTGGGVMRPDFIIPSLKIWIEYDGIQHFEPIDFTSKMSEEQVQEQFKQIQQNDNIKNQYAKDNNWTLIRIPYWQIDNIEQILNSYIKEQEQAI